MTTPPSPRCHRTRSLTLPLVLLIALGAPAPGAQGPAPLQVSPGHAIELDGVELFRVQSALGPFTASERAERAEERLARIAEDPFFSAELFEVALEEDEGRLLYRGETVGVVTPLDAQAEGRSIEDLLARRLVAVRSAIADYRERRLPEENWRAAGLLALATAVFAFVLVGITRLFRWLRRRSEARATREVEGTLHASARQAMRSFEARGFAWARGGLIVVASLLHLEVVFALIPLTRAYALALLDYLLAPLRMLWIGLLAHVGDLFFIAVIALLARYALKLMRWVALEAQRGAVHIPGVDADHALRLFKLARLLVIVAALVAVFPYVPGSDSEAFRGLGLLFGAILTIGSSGTAGNFVGGVMLVFSRLFKVGDRIRVGEVEGDVIEIELLLTRLRTNKNEVVTIPNGSILGGQVINFSTRAATDGLILHTSVTIGYDTPWRQVHELLLAAASRTDGLLADPAPFVHQKQLGDFYVEYELNAYTRDANGMARTYSALHANVQDEFNRAGVQIMSPHYEADPPAPKVVPPENWATVR